MPSNLPFKTPNSKHSLEKLIQESADLHDASHPCRDSFDCRLDEIALIYRHAPVGLGVLDVGLRYRRVNERLAEMNGIPVEDHIGRTMREVIPDLADHFEQEMRKVLQSGEPLLEVEISGVTAALPGVVRTWIVNWLPLKNGDGALVGISLVVQEITARKQAEEALRRISQFPEENPNPVLRVAADGTLLYENSAMRELRSVLKWQIGQPIPDALRAVVDHAIEQDLEVETEITGPDGKTFGFFAIQPHGEKYINLYGTDLTERKKAEEALRESEAQLSAILDELPIGIGVFDHMGGAILINDLMRNHIPDMMPARDPELRQRWQALDSAGKPIPPDQWPCARALRGESVIPGVEFTYTDTDGCKQWAMVSAVPFSHLKGGEIGAITVAQDITELKQVECTLRETNQELNEYTYAVVHNVKAPFRAVGNYANFLLEDLADTLGGESKQFLAGIKNAVHQAHQQFSDLDALYLIRKHTVEFEPVDMLAFLGQFVSLYPNDSDRQLNLSMQWPVLRTDRFLLRQIMMALIDNGFKYNQSAVKRVDIDGQKTTDRFEISVRDNGIGIDPQYHEHIFQIFKRLHTEKEYEGTGIGLALVKKALQKMGGSLRLESAAGEGSTFIASLPTAMIEGGQA